MIGHLNVLDLIFLIIVFLSILLGVVKGFVRELFSLAFFIIGVILAFLFYHEVGKIFFKDMKNRDVANFVGFIIVFTLVLIVGSIVTFLVKKAFVVEPLKSIDRILGGIFGLLRGILISAILVLGFMLFPINDEMLSKSQLSPYLYQTIKVVTTFFPENMKEKLKVRKKNDGQEDSGTGRAV